MLDDLTKGRKIQKQQKPSSEVGILKSVSPFVFTINGIEYSSEHFTVYVPAIDRIKQFKPVAEGGDMPVKIGDFELEPDVYKREFRPGDLIDVTDRGDTFIVHGRLVKL